MITQDTLEEFFTRTRALYEQGKSQFEIDQICRWSFFFVDRSPTKLEPVVKHLESLGYEIQGIIESGEADEDPVYFLRADRVERHTVESLFERTIELYAVARKFDLLDYDGMDVGAIDGP
jgi:hypothetical protein